MLLVIILIVFYGLEIYSDARWDAEAFKEGKSNHTWKSLRIIALFLIVAVFSASSRVLYWEYYWWLKTALMAFIYPFERVVMFDTILNHYRDKPMGYKTTPLWAKWVSGFIVLGLTVLIAIL